MPPRARPGDREKIEAALGPQLGALRGLCDVLGVSPDRWQQVPALDALFTTVGVLRLAAEQQRNGTSARCSIDRAAIALGVSADTAHDRIRRMSG